jgi:hypothetical protein
VDIIRRLKKRVLEAEYVSVFSLRGERY